MKRAAIAGLVISISGALLFAAQPETLSLSNKSPLVTFRVLFKAGSVNDPPGKEGVAALTAAMLSRGGTREKSYDQIVKALFPLAASVAAQVDQEMTVFEGTAHQESLESYYAILRPMLLDPGWREDDFRRLKAETINFLRIQLRSNNEEELGKEALYLQIYKGHPYGHHSGGTVASLNALTLEDVKAFYNANYQRGNAVIGLAGGHPEAFVKKVEADFSRQLPDGTPQPVALPEPKPADKLRFRLIQKETRSTAISLGFPIPVTRSHPDWAALRVMESYLGEHRSSKSYLYQRIREVRGMNYGDYAYIEYFPRGMFQFQPDPNLGRRQQIFQIWIRPVEPDNGVFALRIALYELNKLIEKGISQADFESTRTFLLKQVNLLAQTQSEQLGFELDSKYYGIPSFKTYLRDKLAKLTLDEVNGAIRRHLRSTNLDVVMIAKDTAGLKKALESGAATSPRYVTPPSKDVLEEDKAVRAYKLDVGSIEIVPVDTVFEK
jgi:zinc protease